MFQRYARATREAFAAGLGCDVSAFDGEQLTVVDRPTDAQWYTASAVTFATGTVLAIDPDYRDFVDANRPRAHRRALAPAFLQSLVAEGARRGHVLEYDAPSLCFTLCDHPAVIPVPRGFELREHDAAWMNAEQPHRRFENAVGQPGVGGRGFRNRFALVLVDSRGEHVAVAGAFVLYGMLEIGVDVAPEHRGLGLGRLMVSTIAREIVQRGALPFYACATTNIRSHRTAEASGFSIICCDAAVTAVR